MPYTQKQALVVALYNSGVHGPRGESSMPFELAESVLNYLHQMGFVLDGYVHETMLAKARKDYEESIKDTCGHPMCDQPATAWGACVKHYNEAMDQSPNE